MVMFAMLHFYSCLCRNHEKIRHVTHIRMNSVNVKCKNWRGFIAVSEESDCSPFSSKQGFKGFVPWSLEHLVRKLVVFRASIPHINIFFNNTTSLVRWIKYTRWIEIKEFVKNIAFLCFYNANIAALSSFETQFCLVGGPNRHKSKIG